MKLSLISKKQEYGDIWSFYFLPLEDTTWKAGQSIRLELQRLKWGISERRFTIASAPSENIVQITTKLSGSEFKQLLSELRIQEQINAFNIEGDFTWKDNNKHKLMIAGGVGVTPYRSLLKSKIETDAPCNTTLIYTNKDKHLFEDEFLDWTRRDPSLRVILLNKRLNLEKNSTLLDKWLKSEVYISGSDSMVKRLYGQLIEQKVPKNQINTDIFIGL